MVQSGLAVDLTCKIKIKCILLDLLDLLCRVFSYNVHKVSSQPSTCRLTSSDCDLEERADGSGCRLRYSLMNTRNTRFQRRIVGRSKADASS